MFTRLSALALFAIAVASPALAQPKEILRQPGFMAFENITLCPTPEAALESVNGKNDPSCWVLPHSSMLEGISSVEENGAMAIHLIIRQELSHDGAGLPLPGTVFYPADVYAPVAVNPDVYTVMPSYIILGEFIIERAL